jgi:hypothetical protein
MKVAHVPEAAATVVEVNWVLAINSDCLSEVFDGLLEVLEAVPDQATSIERGSVVWVYLDDAIKVLQRQLKPVPTHLLSYGAEMVEGRDVLGLEVYSSLVILFRLLQLSELVPAKRSVVEGLEMVGVNPDRILVILDGAVELLLLAVGKPAIMVEVSFVRLKLNCRRKAADREVVVAFAVEADTLIVVSIRILGINLDSA